MLSWQLLIGSPKLCWQTCWRFAIPVGGAMVHCVMLEINAQCCQHYSFAPLQWDVYLASKATWQLETSCSSTQLRDLCTFTCVNAVQFCNPFMQYQPQAGTLIDALQAVKLYEIMCINLIDVFRDQLTCNPFTQKMPLAVLLPSHNILAWKLPWQHSLLHACPTINCQLKPQHEAGCGVHHSPTWHVRYARHEEGILWVSQTTKWAGATGKGFCNFLY